MCHRWGFYFVAKPDITGIGSQDFWDVLNHLDDAEGYRKAKQMKNSCGDLTPAAIEHIREVSKRRFAQLILARFVALQLFVEVAQNTPCGLQRKEHRQLWVLLQAYPGILGTEFDLDPFMTLTQRLGGATLKDLKSRISDSCKKLSILRERHLNPATNQFAVTPFYCVLDEAQITVSASSGRWGEFMANDNETKRFILREIWLSWSDLLPSVHMRLVLSGTGIDHRALSDILESSACKIYPYDIVRDIGAFDTPGAQAAYIARYLPITDHDREFLTRAWVWLRGR